MSENQPNYDVPNYWLDVEKVHLEIEKAQQEGRRISHEAARTIASGWWRSGEASALYSFVMTSEITDDLKREIERELENPAITAADHTELGLLLHYVENRQPYEYLGEWSALYLQQPEDEDLAGSDRCEACGAHISEPHAVTCPLDPETDGQE